MSALQQTLFAEVKRAHPKQAFTTTAPFATAIIDPPWPYAAITEERNHKSALTGFIKGGNCEAGYSQTMSIADMASLPIGDLVGGYLQVWATMPFLQEALLLIDTWGFDYITGMCWAKWNRGQDRRTGNGIQAGVGHWYRGSHELILTAKKPNLRSIRTGLPSLFLTPRDGHSEKPDDLHRLVEDHFPGPYLELFGRRPRDGWTVVGDQLAEQPEKVEAFAQRLGFTLRQPGEYFALATSRLAGFRGSRPRRKMP